MQCFAMCGVYDTYRQAQQDQRKQSLDFGWFQRQSFVVSGDQMTDRAEWIFLVQSYIGARDGELANGRRVMQVAEVDKADDLVSIHQNVVIVGVAVNHATA